MACQKICLCNNLPKVVTQLAKSVVPPDMGNGCLDVLTFH